MCSHAEATTVTAKPDSLFDPELDWRERLLDTPAQLRALLERTRRIAVLGVKTPESGAPAYYVPEHAHRAGYEVIPVPVYYPEMRELFGSTAYRTLSAVPGEIDLVDVFRRPQDIPQHVDDILAKRPRAVWLQSGIRHDTVAEQLARAGIEVVQDRCLLVELRRIGR